jgi:uncharacterized protein YciI
MQPSTAAPAGPGPFAVSRLTASRLLASVLFSVAAAAAPAVAAEPPPPTATSTTATATAPQAAAPGPADATPKMTTYYVALLRRGPGWTPNRTPEVGKVLDGHMANIRRLAAEGKLLLAGPFLEQSGPGALAGLFVLQAGSIAEAQQLVATDPAVQAGRFVAEILPWLGPKSLQTLGATPANR